MTQQRQLSCVIVQPGAGLLPWQRVCVERLTEELDVVVAGCLSCPAHTPTHTSVGGITARYLDQITRPRSARRRIAFTHECASVERTATPDREENRRLLNREDSDWIYNLAPDFVVVFDSQWRLHDEDQLASAGIWQFSEGSAQPGDDSSPGLAALTHGDTRLTLSLWAQTRSVPYPIARGHTPAVVHSRKRSLARLYEIAPDLLQRAVNNLRAADTPLLSSSVDSAPDYRSAGWTGFIGAMLRETLRRWFEKIWLRQRWDIGVIPEYAPIPSTQQIAQARWLAGPSSGFWADPCFVAGSTWPALLVEEYLDVSGKGQITRLDWLAGDIDMAPATTTQLRIDTHLSFPRTYEQAGTRWLVPEMAAAGEQRAYRLIDNKQCAQDTSTAMQGLGGIDPVLFFHEGRYWAFISPPGRRSNYQLDLYMADDFFGPYRAHPASPVCIDPHGGRSAGPVIRDGARLLRFGQVFGRHYGEAIDVFEITELTPESYGERRVDRIRPAPTAGAGMHTIDFAAGLTVVDRFRLEPVWRLLLARWQVSRAG